VGRTPARYSALAGLVVLAAVAPAQPPAFVPLPALAGEIRELAGSDRIEAFALADGIALVAVGSGEPNRSVIRAARGTARPSLAVNARVVALAASPTGEAWAIVRESDRKGIERRAALVAVDLASGKLGRGIPLPISAQGLGLSGSTMLVASTDEIRTFHLPHLTSGPLYRVPGPNIGIAAAPWDATVWIVAQVERVGLVDVDEPQGREGLVLQATAPAPMPLRALGPGLGGELIALGTTGDAWKVEVERSIAEPPRIPNPVPLPVPHEAPPVPAPPPPTPEPTPTPTPLPPGSLAGTIAGEARGSVDYVLALGPDNVLREAGRVRPAPDGTYRFDGLEPGTYRIVAAGPGGRVIICKPPYLTVRLDGSQPVAVPALRAVRVP